jgi:hypothetical protein
MSEGTNGKLNAAIIYKAFYPEAGGKGCRVSFAILEVALPAVARNEHLPVQ